MDPAFRYPVEWIDRFQLPRGDVLRSNAPMLALARASGFHVQRHPDNATLVRVQSLLATPVTPKSIAVCA